jgi:putative transposase
MTYRKTFRYRLKPTHTHQILFSQFAGSCRYVYNWALALCKSIYALDKTLLNYVTLAKKLTLLKKAIETMWLADVHSQVLQQSLKDLEIAFKKFFKEGAGYPQFKKKGKKDSFRYPQGVQVNNGKVYLPIIGWVPFYNSRQIEGIIKQVTVKRQGKHWYIALSCIIEKELLVRQLNVATMVGIDLGLNRYATLSNGIVIENQRFLRSYLDKLAWEQRKLSRKKKGSNNFKKQVLRVHKCHIKIANCRNDFAHKETTKIVKNHDIIVVEDLNIKGMVQNHCLALSISDAGWQDFVFKLQYKATWHEKLLVKIDRFEPSSKKCSSCGSKQDMPLHVRTYKCQCGLEMDRDLNASINIKAAGHAVLNACGGLNSGSPYEAGIHGF